MAGVTFASSSGLPEIDVTGLALNAAPASNARIHASYFAFVAGQEIQGFLVELPPDAPPLTEDASCTPYRVGFKCVFTPGVVVVPTAAGWVYFEAKPAATGDGVIGLTSSTIRARPVAAFAVP